MEYKKNNTISEGTEAREYVSRKIEELEIEMNNIRKKILDNNYDILNELSALKLIASSLGRKLEKTLLR